jgi:cellulose synthase/poly-beta-1,6-N-acetylglucosamine synthase-like glycosyltransferase
MIVHAVIILILLFFAVELGWAWASILGNTLASRRNLSRLPPPPAANPSTALPRFCVVTACRDGAACIPGLIESFRAQAYPADRVSLFLVADNCSDQSADVARSFGMDVYERHDIHTTGKGNALNEVLDKRLRQEPFDILVVLDIDARVKPDFLRRAAAYFKPGEAMVLSCATYAKNPDQSLFTRVGTRIQTLIRVHQEGRAAIGLGAVLYGSHGYALSRAALDRLGWHTTTGLITEDMELRLRATLAAIPVRYAPDLPVENDVTTDAASTREQRRRWNSIYFPLVARYTWPLVRQALRGRGAALDGLFGLLLFPAFANLFLYMLLTTFFLSALAWRYPVFSPYAVIAALFWVLHGLYFVAAFKQSGDALRIKDLWAFTVYLGVRLIALFEALFYVRVTNWAPAPHEKDMK